MTTACEQVARTLESVARIIRAVGQEAAIAGGEVAEVAAVIAETTAPPPKSPRLNKPGKQASLPAPERKKPGRKPKADQSEPKTGPRGKGTDESPGGIQVDTRAFGSVRKAIIAFLRRTGTADVAMIAQATGLERTQIKNALVYGMARGAFITPQTGFWKVDPDYED